MTLWFWFALFALVLCLIDVLRVPFYFARELWWMKRRLEQGEGVKVHRIVRERAGRYRIDASGWGDQNSIWMIWIPWRRKVDWHYTPHYEEKPDDR